MLERAAVLELIETEMRLCMRLRAIEKDPGMDAYWRGQENLLSNLRGEIHWLADA